MSAPLLLLSDLESFTRDTPTSGARFFRTADGIREEWPAGVEPVQVEAAEDALARLTAEPWWEWLEEGDEIPLYVVYAPREAPTLTPEEIAFGLSLRDG